jgi:enoyl-CoA hydratase/carnithine racemase
VIAVQGCCYTVAVELCLAADVVIAAESAQFTQFEVRRRIMPFGGATLRFAQIAGDQNALRYVRTMMDETRKLVASDDALEGVRSFVERRAAKFIGK